MINEVVEWLGQTSLLQDFKNHPDGLAYLVSFLKEARYSKGENILSVGLKDECVYFLLEGEADVFKLTPDGDEFKVASLKAWDFPYFGEGALLHDDARHSTIRAMSDCRCLTLTRGDFEIFCQNRPEWGFPIMKNIALVLSSRLRKASRDFVLTYQALIAEIRSA